MPVAVVGLFSTLEVISVVITLLLRISTVVVDIAGVPVVLSAFKTAQEKKKKEKQWYYLSLFGDVSLILHSANIRATIKRVNKHTHNVLLLTYGYSKIMFTLYNTL